jgi:hypothetical protein
MRNIQQLHTAVILLTTWGFASGQPSELPCVSKGFSTNSKLEEVRPGKSITTNNFCGTSQTCSMTLKPGDPIVVDRVEGDWTCGYFTNWEGDPQGFLKGMITPQQGWVRSREIYPVAVATNPPLSAWVGTWVEGWDRITIESSKTWGKLSLVGQARGLGPTDEAISGQFSGQATPVGNHLHLTDWALTRTCEVDLTLAGKYILAKDNNKCSDTYVRFWGIWKRARVESK